MNAPYYAEKDAPCCVCTKPGIAFVIDGPHHKPVCKQHGRMYRQQGYRITGGPSIPPLTMTSAEWLGALADAWDQGYAKAVRDEVPTTPLRRPGNPYRVLPPGVGA